MGKYILKNEDTNNSLYVNWLIETNIELIEEDIDIQSIEELPIYCPASDRTLKINELIKAVKQLNNKIK